MYCPVLTTCIFAHVLCAGQHIGKYLTPAKEDDPRVLGPMFYYDLQDYLTERWAAAAPAGWKICVSCLNVVLHVTQCMVHQADMMLSLPSPVPLTCCCDVSG